MPKHTMYQKEIPPKLSTQPPHPIWRGIGCIIIIVIPIISYFAAVLLFDSRSVLPWLIIPDDVVVTTLGDPYIFVKIIYAALIALILFLVFAAITFFLNRSLGTSRFGPLDVPPEKIEKRQKKS